YEIRDLGVQVVVDNVKNTVEDEELEYLTQQEQSNVENGITSILDSIIATTIQYEDEEGEEEVDPEEKMSIVFQEFTGGMQSDEPAGGQIPMWLYIVGAILLIIIIALVVYLIRNRNREEEYEEIIEYEEEKPEAPQETPKMEMPDESEAVVKRKQLEKAAKENPEDFAKLLRTWIGED